jgi:hypothetical protein
MSMCSSFVPILLPYSSLSFYACICPNNLHGCVFDLGMSASPISILSANAIVTYYNTCCLTGCIDLDSVLGIS